MSNLQFEYQNSISINALTLLCIDLNEFDMHKKGIQLSDMFNKLLPTIKSECKSGEFRILRVREAEQSADSDLDNLNEMLPPEKDLSQKLFAFREQIKAAIRNKEIELDEYDTKDCCEIRLDFVSAKKWLKKEICIDVYNAHSADWRKDKKDNFLLIISALMQMNNKEFNNKSAGEIADILMDHTIERDTRTITAHLKKAAACLNHLKEESKKVK
jgi:hypothetical protein